MKLFELFDGPAKWRFTENTETDAVAEFDINGVGYILTLWTIGQYGNWGLEFENTTVSPNQRFGITGQGSASTVFATVCDILKRFIARRDVYTMQFAAEEPNRKKLYKRIVTTVFPGWSISEDGTIITVEKKGKYREGRVSDKLILDKEWERQNGPQPEPTPPVRQMNYVVTINSKPWKEFATEPEAMRVATAVYNKNRRLRVSVTPK